MPTIPSPTDTPTAQPASIRPLLFIVLVLCILFFTSYIARLQQAGSLDEQIAAARAKLELTQIQNGQLRADLARGRSEEYDGDIARQELDMARYGEQPYTVLTPVARPASVTNGDFSASAPAPIDEVETTTTDITPIWRQWINLFTP